MALYNFYYTNCHVYNLLYNGSFSIGGSRLEQNIKIFPRNIPSSSALGKTLWSARLFKVKIPFQGLTDQTVSMVHGALIGRILTFSFLGFPPNMLGWILGTIFRCRLWYWMQNCDHARNKVIFRNTAPSIFHPLVAIESNLSLTKNPFWGAFPQNPEFFLLISISCL